MLAIGDPTVTMVILGLVALLCVYWVAKWVISIWTGS